MTPSSPLRMSLLGLSVAASVAIATCAQASVVVTTERLNDDGNFNFATIPTYSNNDLLEGSSPTFQDGGAHSASGPVTNLTDGLVQDNNGSASQSFFFSDSGGGNGSISNGRLVFDLGSATAIAQINAFAWHSNERAALNFSVYGALGTEIGLDLTPAVADGDLASLGYTLIGSVNTLGLGMGGQHGASIADSLGGSIGTYRYLVFDIFPSDPSDPNFPEGATTNTFFSEIDVKGAAVPEPSTIVLLLAASVLVMAKVRTWRRAAV